MEKYGAKLLFNNWNYADPPANFGPDFEHQVWFKPSEELVISYYSRQSYGQDGHYLFIAASSSSDNQPEVTNLKKILELK